jgi:hypothetical protein
LKCFSWRISSDSLIEVFINKIKQQLILEVQLLPAKKPAKKEVKPAKKK